MTFDEQIAVRTLAMEVRGEPPEGQLAVAHVLLNRVASGRWGKTLATVCLWHGQFSGWYVPSDPNFAYACALRDDDPVMLKMFAILRQAIGAVVDPTGGATNYYNPVLVQNPPVWVTGDSSRGIAAAIPCGKFGHHEFYKGVK